EPFGRSFRRRLRPYSFDVHFAQVLLCSSSIVVQRVQEAADAPLSCWRNVIQTSRVRPAAGRRADCSNPEYLFETFLRRCASLGQRRGGRYADRKEIGWWVNWNHKRSDRG